MIKLTKLTFSYKAPVFKNTNFIFDFDKITLLTGENGCGKTTLFRLLCGLEKRYTGKILLNDKNLKSQSASEIAKSIIYHKQEANLNIIGVTPLDDLKIWYGKFQKKVNEEILQKKLESFGILHLADTPIWKLSTGELRKTGLAAVSGFHQKYWLLDEPEGGLEEKSLQKFIELLRNRRQNGYGALIATHRQELYKDIADVILKIENGTICKV